MTQLVLPPNAFGFGPQSILGYFQFPRRPTPESKRWEPATPVIGDTVTVYPGFQNTSGQGGTIRLTVRAIGPSGQRVVLLNQDTEFGGSHAPWGGPRPVTGGALSFVPDETGEWYVDLGVGGQFQSIGTEMTPRFSVLPASAAAPVDITVRGGNFSVGGKPDNFGVTITTDSPEVEIRRVAMTLHNGKYSHTAMPTDTYAAGIDNNVVTFRSAWGAGDVDKSTSSFVPLTPFPLTETARLLVTCRFAPQNKGAASVTIDVECSDGSTRQLVVPATVG